MAVPILTQGVAFAFAELYEAPIPPFLQLSITTGQLLLLHWGQPAIIVQTGI